MSLCIKSNWNLVPSAITEDDMKYISYRFFTFSWAALPQKLIRAQMPFTWLSIHFQLSLIVVFRVGGRRWHQCPFDVKTHFVEQTQKTALLKVPGMSIRFRWRKYFFTQIAQRTMTKNVETLSYFSLSSCSENTIQRLRKHWHQTSKRPTLLLLLHRSLPQWIKRNER